MKVKIGDKIYDSNEEPIMLILEDYNKKHIRDMPDNSKKYLEYPEHMTEEDAIEFMYVEDENV